MCSNNILVKEKYGFRINSFTEAASYSAINNIYIDMNNRLSVGEIFCDLEKAFHCFYLGIKVDKLEFSGISGIFQTFIQSYLRGRYQQVLIDKINAYDGVSSTWKIVINGLPRVFILGSSLLLIYINDLPKITDNDAKVMLFAAFQANFLSVKFNEMYYLEFTTKDYIVICFLLGNSAASQC